MLSLGFGFEGTIELCAALTAMPQLRMLDLTATWMRWADAIDHAIDGHECLSLPDDYVFGNETVDHMQFMPQDNFEHIHLRYETAPPMQSAPPGWSGVRRWQDATA